MASSDRAPDTPETITDQLFFFPQVVTRVREKVSTPCLVSFLITFSPNTGQRGEVGLVPLCQSACIIPYFIAVLPLEFLTRAL